MRNKNFATRLTAGFVLPTALVFLVVLSALAIGMARIGLLQQRLAGAQRNMQLAMDGAEAALRGAEWKLWKAAATAYPVHCDGQGSQGCFMHAAYGSYPEVDAFRRPEAWVTGGGTEYRAAYYAADSEDGTYRLASSPWFLIEDMGLERDGGSPAKESQSTAIGGVRLHLYRITARARGANEGVVRVLESTFVAPGN
jgi:type IV pilus assembly protein PilX